MKPPKSRQFINRATIFGLLLVAACQGSPTSLTQSIDPNAGQRRLAAEIASKFVQDRNAVSDLNAVKTNISRHRVVSVDNAAADRLFELAASRGKRLGESFTLNVFPDATCTIANTRNMTITDTSVRVDLACKEDKRWEAVATLDKENNSYNFRFRDNCHSENPRYEISTLQGTNYAIAYETQFTMTALAVLMC